MVFSSIRSRFFGAIAVLGLLVVGLTALAIEQIHVVGAAAEDLVVRRFPWTVSSEEALIALDDGVRNIERALLVGDPDQLEALQRIEGRFRESEILFRLYAQALLWGTESMPFRRSAGGLIHSEWKRRGLSERLLVKRISDEFRPMVEEAYLYYGAFAKHVRRVLALQKKQLRMRRFGEVVDYAALRAEQATAVERAEHYYEQVEGSLREVIERVRHAVVSTGVDVQNVRETAGAMLLASCGAVFGFGLLIVWWVSERITKPIIRLRDAVANVGKGRYASGTLDLDAADEVGDLSRSFEQMVKDLKSSTDQQQELAATMAAAEAERRQAMTLRRLNLQLTAEVKERAKAESGLRSANEEMTMHSRALLNVLADLKQSHEHQKSIQSQLIQAEKLGAIGQLASGVAHEVKNPLGIILQGVGYLEQADGEDPESSTEVLQMMREAVVRADGIIKAMLNFSRPVALELRAVVITKVIEASLALVEAPIATKGIHVTRSFGEGIPLVLLDENQMKQVFINLIMNAVQAMPQGGQLSFRCFRMTVGAGERRANRRKSDTFRPNQEIVVCEVVDSGKGIPKEMIDKVFDPFFTTKAPGEGTGLGLAVTQSIIESHGGKIAVESEVGLGTTVRISLPVTKVTMDG